MLSDTLTIGMHKKYKLVDVEKPNLIRHIFPYKKPPFIHFDNVTVPVNLPDDMWITDTSFRDGQQSLPPFTVKQIVGMFDLIHKINGKSRLIRQSEFFLYSEKDRQAVEACRDRGYKYPEVTGWIRAVPDDFKLVKKLQLRETGILTSVSDYHIFLKMFSNRRKIMDQYLGVVKAALSAGVIPRCHFEDVTRADIFGFVVPFAQELMHLSEESGIPIKIRLCDTMGFGLPNAEAALPRSVPKLVHALTNGAGVPSEMLEWHGHNDFHKVHANSVAAWLYGVSGINGAFFGMGERTGNSPIEALIFEYIGLKGDFEGIQTTRITELAQFVKEEIGLRLSDNVPFVGKNFNVTRAGIHADGVIKNEEIYNIFDTEKILGRPIDVLITDKSGIAGIAWWINSKIELAPDAKIGKRHPGIKKIYDKIMKLYNRDKRITGISDEEMFALVRRYIPELFVSDFDQIKQRVEHIAENVILDILHEAHVDSIDAEQLEDQLGSIIEQNPIIQLIVIVDKQGHRVTHNITQTQDIGKFSTYDNQEFATREWFAKPMETGKNFVTDIYKSEYTGKLIITSATPIWDANDAVIGVLSLDIKFEDAARLEDVPLLGVYQSVFNREFKDTE